MQRSTTRPGSIPPDPTAWRAVAACRGLDSALFFPKRGESPAEAVAVCGGCVVRADCATYALESGQRFGIWGGLSGRQRRRARAVPQGAMA
jgi:WhiB family redox-sensing transcriptional regulator